MKLNNVDLNKMRVFSSVVRAGGYSKACEDLNLSRSAISQSVSTLESQLGIRLFHRKGRRVIPTREALTLFEGFDHYHQTLSNSLSKIRGSKGRVHGLVRIGAYLEFTKVHLAPLISSFIKRFSEVQFKLTFDSPTRLNNLLEKGSIDMAFSIFPYSGRKGIESLRILKEELVLISPLEYLRKTFSLNSLFTLPIIDYYPNHQLIQRWIQCHFKKRIKNAPIQIFGASAEIVLKMVQSGAGVGVVPKYLADSEKDILRFKVSRPTSKKLVDYIWLNQFRNGYTNLAHQEFHRFLIKDRRTL